MIYIHLYTHLPMSILSVSRDSMLNITGFLKNCDLRGFRISCKKVSKMMMWSFDDHGVHLCLIVDMTCSMGASYKKLKKYLLQTIEELKANDTVGRTLVSSMFYWDLERSEDGKPYLQIQPPAEHFAKQKQLISNAKLDNGGGPECGGIAMAELNKQFRYSWMNQTGNVFNKSMDIALMCLDAPFHFMEDAHNYHASARRHAIDKDWVRAFHSLYKKGVIVVMLIISNQPNFWKSLQLLGAFNDALGGISIKLQPKQLNKLPAFMQAIITEETQRRHHINNLYKSISYTRGKLTRDEMSNAILDALQTSDVHIECANIPKKIMIKADDSPLAARLASCKTLNEAINAGIFESEIVTERLLKRQFPDYNTPLPLPLSSSDETNDDLPPMGIIPLQRQLTQPPKWYNQPRQITQPMQLTQQLTQPPRHRITISPPQKKQTKKVSFAQLPSRRQTISTFGLVRQKSEAAPYDGQMIDGSIKCTARIPSVDFAHIPQVIDVNAPEAKFREELLAKNKHQHELYINGGFMGRFAANPCIDEPFTNGAANGVASSADIIGAMPILMRSISEVGSRSANARLLNTL